MINPKPETPSPGGPKNCIAGSSQAKEIMTSMPTLFCGGGVGFRVWGLIGLQGLGFRVWGLGFRIGAYGLGLGFGVWVLGFRVSCTLFCGLGGFGFRV